NEPNNYGVRDANTVLQMAYPLEFESPVTLTCYLDVVVFAAMSRISYLDVVVFAAMSRIRNEPNNYGVRDANTVLQMAYVQNKFFRWQMSQIIMESATQIQFFRWPMSRIRNEPNNYGVRDANTVLQMAYADCHMKTPELNLSTNSVNQPQHRHTFLKFPELAHLVLFYNGQMDEKGYQLIVTPTVKVTVKTRTSTVEPRLSELLPLRCSERFGLFRHLLLFLAIPQKILVEMVVSGPWSKLTFGYMPY
ncbi:hypothetical protein L9F63_020832, partial [Diploptera punctata]